MKNKSKLVLLAAISPLLVTGCSTKEQKAVNKIEQDLLTILKQDGYILNDFENVDKLDYDFKKYEIVENDSHFELNILGKLFNENKNSYLTLNYNNVDFSKYNFTDDKVNNYNAINNIINDYNYSAKNVFVNNYKNFDNAFKPSFPEKDSDGYRFDSLEVLNVNNINYNNDAQCVQFDSDLIVDYIHRSTTIILAGPGSPVPITSTYHHYQNHNFNVEFKVNKNDYEANKNNTAKLLEVFENYVKENQANNYSITEASQKSNINKAEYEGMSM